MSGAVEDLDPTSLARVLGALVETAGIKSSFALPRGVEVSVRKSGQRQWIFVLNHTAASQEISLPGQFKDQLTGTIHSGSTTLNPYDVLVLQRA